LQDYCEISQQVAGYYKHHRNMEKHRAIKRVHDSLRKIVTRYSRNKPFTFNKLEQGL
jgi:hypothetical protein